MCKLGTEKGYRLVGTHRFGFNAFFIKDGVGDDFFRGKSGVVMTDSFTQSLLREKWLRIVALIG
jgi:hypothetical protein